MKTTLEPIYDTRKSFYGKAIVTIDACLWGNDIELSAPGENFSFSTDVDKDPFQFCVIV